MRWITEGILPKECLAAGAKTQKGYQLKAFLPKTCGCKLVLLGMVGAVFLAGCAHPRPINGLNSTTPFVEAKAKDDSVSETMANQDFVLPDDPNSDAVLTSDGFGNTPKLLEAYHKYLASGHAQNIKGQGIVTLAYSAYKRPLLTCQPLSLCQIILEKGEILQDYSVGDPTRWQPKEMHMGTGESSSTILVLKPSSKDIATDLTITTDKRIYRFALLSKSGVDSPTVNFWYPQATLNAVIAKSQHHFERKNKSEKNAISHDSISIKDANFNYSVTGSRPAWMPNQAFDDGHKTFIRFPAVTQSVNLPVFFVDTNGTQSLANYRYKKPYLIFDGVFKRAMLVSGKGSNKVQVNLINNSYPR